MWKKVYRLFRYDWPIHFILFFTNWLPDNVFFLRLRGKLASPFLRQCGKNLRLGRDITLYNSAKIFIGNNVYIAKGCWFSGTYGITICDDVMFGPYVIIVTSNHSINDGIYTSENDVTKEQVIIGKGSWISSHVTILPGTTIKETVLLAANSVIKGKTTKFGVYGGVPAKLIKIANGK